MAQHLLDGVHQRQYTVRMRDRSRSSRDRRPNYALTRAGRRQRYAVRRVIVLLVLGVVAAAIVVLVITLSGNGDRSGGNRSGAQVIDFTIDSRLVHGTLPAVAVIPPGTTGAGRPLLVFLHGKGGNQDTSLTSQMFAALAAQGAGAPDIVFPYGGPDSYWHNRADGAWGSYVTDEVIPRALALVHADPRRVAIGGISMGGFGALDIARLHRGRFCAVGGHSAAVYFSYPGSAAGAFDNPADFGRNNLIGSASRSDPYGGTPVWLDVGSSDPFRGDDTSLARDLRAHGAKVTFSIAPGGHDDAYWNSRWADYLAFYARALRSCRRT